MSGKGIVGNLQAAKWSKLIFSILGTAMFVVGFFFCRITSSHAAIVASGSVGPDNPTTWTKSTTGYIGATAYGWLTVDAGSALLSSTCNLGFYSTSANGTATITGIGSKWTNTADLYVGKKGIGTLNIQAGGQIINGTGWVGYGYVGTATVTGTGSKWTNSGDLSVGYFGGSSGTLNIQAGGQVSDATGWVGRYGGRGTVTVADTGSMWTNSGDLYVGGTNNDGTLKIQAGGQVSNATCWIGHSSSSGTVTITDAGSQWTNSGDLHVECTQGGNLTVTNGGVVTAITLYASSSNLLGNGTINIQGAVLDANLVFDSTHGLQQTLSFGTGGKINLTQSSNGDLGIGCKNTGTLRIADGMNIASSEGYLGYMYGSTGTATVTGINSKWINSSTMEVGVSGNGTLNIQAGGQVSNTKGYVGSSFGSYGSVMVTGTDSKWSNSGDLYVGCYGGGGLNIQAGGQVSNSTGYLGYSGYGTAIITGPDSQWVNSGDLHVGSTSGGSLQITAGGKVSNSKGSIYGDSQVTVTGTGSMWTNSGDLTILTSDDISHKLTLNDGGIVTAATLFASISNLYGNGTINIQGAVLDANLVFDSTHGLQQTLSFGTGGKINLTQSSSCALGVGCNKAGTLLIAQGVNVVSSSGYLGYTFNSTGNATVTGAGSKWTNSGNLYIGDSGVGILNIQAGGEVTSLTGYVDYGSNVSIVDIGSKWINSGNLYVGYSSNNTCTLNIGNNSSGGLVMSTTLTLAYGNNNNVFCNLSNGGILQVGFITKGSGAANFNWNDGTIQNHDPTSDLKINSANNLILKLAATGTHAFNIDSSCTGTVDAILGNATTGGSLKKIGTGTLLLTAANTYSGATTIEEGRFKVTDSILNANGITVKEAGILELAKITGSATSAILNIDNAGTVLISAGSQKVGTINGTGITQVTGSATLTANSIMQNTLTIGGTGAGSMSTVPEPSTIALLSMGAIGLITYGWRRRKA